MVEHELLGVQQRPEDVVISLRLLLGDAPVCSSLTSSASVGMRPKQRRYSSPRDLARRQVRLHQLLDHAALGDLVLDGVPLIRCRPG